MSDADPAAPGDVSAVRETLFAMFPALPRETVLTALSGSGGDVETAIEMLLSLSAQQEAGGIGGGDDGGGGGGLMPWERHEVAQFTAPAMSASSDQDSEAAQLAADEVSQHAAPPVAAAGSQQDGLSGASPPEAPRPEATPPTVSPPRIVFQRPSRPPRRRSRASCSSRSSSRKASTGSRKTTRPSAKCS